MTVSQRIVVIGLTTVLVEHAVPVVGPLVHKHIRWISVLRRGRCVQLGEKRPRQLDEFTPLTTLLHVLREGMVYVCSRRIDNTHVTLAKALRRHASDLAPWRPRERDVDDHVLEVHAPTRSLVQEL